MNYCSHCGISALSFTIPAGDLLPRYCCTNCGTIHYQNPNMVVGTIPVFEDKILLCQRAIEPRLGYWNVPAGFLENGETVEEGALRETREEAQAEVEIVRLHCVYNIIHAQQVYLLFLARLKKPEFACGIETAAIELISMDKIPFEKLAFSSNTFALQKLQQYPDVEVVHFGSYVKP